jgi:hypothetical protein
VLTVETDYSIGKKDHLLKLWDLHIVVAIAEKGFA